jgi:hypothetical protein
MIAEQSGSGSLERIDLSVLGKETTNSFREELACLEGSVRGLTYRLGKITTEAITGDDTLIVENST